MFEFQKITNQIISVKYNPPDDWDERRYKFNTKKKRAFLKHLSTSGRPALSALVCSVSLSTVNEHRETDPNFNTSYEEALAIYSDLVSQEVERRSTLGWDEPVFGGRFKDEVVGYIKRYSDQLLALHAKRFVPEYKDKITVDQTTKLDAKVDLQGKLDLGKLSDRELDLVTQLLGDTIEKESE